MSIEIVPSAEQLSVMTHVDGPACVLAGAGSGKTETLGCRILRLIESGVDPWRILCVTFSARAKDDMIRRLQKKGVPVIPEDRRGVHVRTWNGLGYFILRESDVPIAQCQVDASGSRMRRAVSDACRFLKFWDADEKKLVRYIGLLKAHYVSCDSLLAKQLAESLRLPPQIAASVSEHVDRIVETTGFLTYDDMIFYALRHLDDKQSRARWSARWQYIVEDEAQDANASQAIFAARLSESHGNLMKVGDPAQSIYGFRGSAPSHLMDFIKSSRAQVYCLSRNYRSGRTIVSAANGIIRPATIRLPEDLRPERDEEGCVSASDWATGDDAAEAVAQTIAAHIDDGGCPSKCAVLYRTHAWSGAIEGALVRAGIPYYVEGGGSFYERSEVRSLLAYLRVASGRNPEAIEDCINTPKRYLGAKFMERVMEAAERPGALDSGWGSLVREAVDLELPGARPLNRGQRKGALEWADVIDSAMRMVVDGKPPHDVLQAIALSTNYVESLGSGVDEDDSAQNNVHAVFAASRRYKTVSAFLDFIDSTIEEAAKRRRGEGGASVVLMTIHKSKGLEWPKVWIVGMDDRTMPIAWSDDAEEERRIAYVAVTRAKDELNISYCGVPSRFLSDAGLVTLATAA